MTGSIPSMWGMDTVTLIKLGCSSSLGPVYWMCAEKGSAPTDPGMRDWQMAVSLLTKDERRRNVKYVFSFHSIHALRKIKCFHRKRWFC
jgi:hypothetical protein